MVGKVLKRGSFAARFGISSATEEDGDLFIVDADGKVGIGTTSPYTKLSVVGPVVAEYFNATSTNATTTLAGGLNVGSGGLVYDHQTGNVGIGTAEPSARLDLSHESQGYEEYIRFGARNTGDVGDSGGGIKWQGEWPGYSKFSAGIFAVKEGHFFRQGLAFYTGNDEDKPRMLLKEFA